MRFVVGFLALSSALALAADTQPDLAAHAEQLLRSGQKTETLDVLTQASSAPSPTAASEDQIGFLYAVLQQGSDAETHFRKAIALDANYAAAHFHLGVALWNEGVHTAALSELEAAVALDPRNFQYRYRLGAADLRNNDFEHAAAELEQAVAIDASSAPAWADYGQALQGKDDLGRSVAAYAKATDLAPEDDAVRNAYSSLLIETRQADRGIEEARKVLAHNARDISAYMNIGYAELKKGDFDAAEKTYRELLALEPNLAAAHYDLGIALKSKDQLEEAKKEFQEAIRIDPALPQAHYSLGIADWQLGDFSGLADEMRAAIKVSPEYAEAHYMLGIALKENGDADAALGELREAIRLDPSSPGPYNTIGQILRLKGDKAGSAEAFATGARLKQEKESHLASALEQGMRGGEMMKPIATMPQESAPR